MDEILQRLERIEATLATLVKPRQVQRWYDTKAAAEFLGKAPYTVREYCRLGGVHAQKRASGRGNSKEWMISHEELIRFLEEGLLPPNKKRGVRD